MDSSRRDEGAVGRGGEAAEQARVLRTDTLPAEAPAVPVRLAPALAPAADAAFVDLVQRTGLSPAWCLGASALLAQHDGPAGA